MEKNRAAQRAEKRHYWEEHIKSWKDSGLTQTQYCREKDLRMHQFWYWKKRIFPVKPSATLVELPVRTLLAGSVSPVTVVVDSIFRIEVGKGFDPLVLEQVLRVVGGL